MNKLGNIIVILVVVVLFASSFIFIVDERELVIKRRFGEIVKSDYEPGLHFKLLIWNDILKFPRQILTISNPQELFLTLEKKNLFVDFFIKWQVEDAAVYYNATGGAEFIAAQRLLEIVKDGIRAEFAKRTVPEVVTAERRELMDDMLNAVRMNAKELGVSVIDVRVKRIEFSDTVSESVFDRMRQERARTAAGLRAEGAENAELIRANADRERTVILAEAYRDAEILRGEGDALSAQIYAQAYEKDPDFYSFTRSIEAYRRSLGTSNDLLVLDSEGDFFRYLKKSGGK